MLVAVCSFIILFAARALGFWGYVLQNPGAVDLYSLRSWLSNDFLPLLMAAAAWSVFLGMGRRMRSPLNLPERGLPDAASSAALGLLLTGTAVFFLGWSGGLTPVYLIAVSSFLAAFSIGTLKFPRLQWPSLGPLEGLCAGLLSFVAVCSLLDALAPPVLWDARAYHLVIPELALHAGRFSPLPWLLHSHWPHLMECLYSLPLAAGRDSVAALLHWGAAALLVASVFSLSDKSAGRPAAWTAALLLAAQPAFSSEAGAAHSDAAAALLAFCAASTLARWDSERRPRLAAFAGLLAGGAVAVKLTLVAPFAAWTAWLCVKRRPRDAGVFVLCGAAMFAPWLLKTWLETGDPVWPFLSSFTGDAAGAALASRNAISNRWGLPLPFWAFTQDGPGFLLIPFVVACALSGQKRSPASATERWLWIAGLPLAAISLPQHAAWRYLMPLWPAFALSTGRCLTVALKQGRTHAGLAVAVVAIGISPIISLSPNNQLFAVISPRPSSAPAADRRSLWEDRSLDGLPSFYREARAALPPDARVLLFREIRGYHAGFDYLWGDPMNQALIDYRSLAGPEELYARLRALGVTDVLDHPGSALYREDPGYYDRRTLALMAECLHRHGRIVLERDGLTLHRLL
jgi:hypothetical protein